MKKFNQLSKAEMKKVSGGDRPIPPCTTDQRACIIISESGYTAPGYCKDLGGGACGCYNPYSGSGQQNGDCYAD